MSMFEIATRKKYRFPFRGLISTEDLWDLTLEQLDTVYKTLNKQVKTEEETSLMTQSATDETTLNMIEIVKHIFTTKQEEANTRKMAAKNAEKKKRILEVIAQKQDESLMKMSVDDLQKLADELEK